MQDKKNGMGLAKLAMLGLVAGGSSMVVGCFDSTSSSDDVKSSTESSSATGELKVGDATSPEQFKELCLEEGGTINETTCTGQAKCAGAYWNSDSDENTYLEAAGTNSCNGIQCLPGAEMSSMETSSSTEVDENANATESQKKVLAATTQEEFKTLCEEISGAVNTVECKGQATCAGIVWSESEKSASLSSCQGTNTCAGTQCIEGTTMSSDMEMSSAAEVTDKEAAKKMALEATTPEAFMKACESAGVEVVANPTCSGYNSCKGVYFNEAEGSASEVVCQGHASCKGSSCSL